ncbi:MAG: YajQ family cyclic di-GMP-binding protein [Gammaproteobacteria bacterium TMED119]|nr:MAG: YajQ family cyclic di-GMP-binding protein [Gammaproteobacteria bacterium TMED119]RCL46554.1 MAG: YajQ family cyclic di-GMP-binding protein [Candidatus Thioglobus sp.]|tara:strand:+ start:972 stop:1454 length:483 start_codon:yes stop_codon:yes gene_type:complete
MPSFDIVSEVDTHELSNAVDQAHREISNRFDFKGSDAKVTLKDTIVTMEAQVEFQIKQIYDVVTQKMAKRGIDLACVEKSKLQEGNNRATQNVVINQGIDSEIAKKITKSLKQQNFKIQTQVQGEKVRVTGKKRDDLQQAMQFLREMSLGVPLQFNNFRD